MRWLSETLRAWRYLTSRIGPTGNQRIMNRPVRYCRLIVIGTVLLALGSLQSQAKSACAGLSEASCQRNDLCSWVRGYTTKSGTSVKAYCRLKAARKSASAQTDRQATKKTEAGKRTDTSASETTTVETSGETPQKKTSETAGKGDKAKTGGKKSSSRKSDKDVSKKTPRTTKSKTQEERKTQ